MFSAIFVVDNHVELTIAYYNESEPDIDKLKEMIFSVGYENNQSENILNYVWDNVIMPQAGLTKPAPLYREM